MDILTSILIAVAFWGVMWVVKQWAVADAHKIAYERIMERLPIMVDKIIERKLNPPTNEESPLQEMVVELNINEEFDNFMKLKKSQQ